MNNHKRKRTTNTIDFHKDFKEPTAQDRKDALGQFPSSEHRPNTLWATTKADQLDDLDRPFLYQPTSETNKPVPKPRDELDWLAQLSEDGQSFQDYVQFQTLRSGRLRPIANGKGSTICLLPILEHDNNDNMSRSTQDVNDKDPEDGTSQPDENVTVVDRVDTHQDGANHAQWPQGAPPLESLVDMTQAFFGRPVRLLPPALVSRQSAPRTSTKTPGAVFATKKHESRFRIQFLDDDNKSASARVVLESQLSGRYDAPTNRYQLSVDSVLGELGHFRSHVFPHENFCIMGITMQDLYDGPQDLFCAGMAAGGSKVAVFSFARYHPTLRMSPLHWWDYGYQTTCGTYSYFEPEERPKGLAAQPPVQLSGRGTVEFLRRASKLVNHELGHLYGLDHCIYYNCLMRGTGHLVEDFAAPFHVCGICLRKLQWRLGFHVQARYHELERVLKKTMGNTSQEAAWAKRQATHIQKRRKQESDQP